MRSAAIPTQKPDGKYKSCTRPRTGIPYKLRSRLNGCIFWTRFILAKPGIPPPCEELQETGLRCVSMSRPLGRPRAETRRQQTDNPASADGPRPQCKDTRKTRLDLPREHTQQCQAGVVRPSRGPPAALERERPECGIQVSVDFSSIRLLPRCEAGALMTMAMAGSVRLIWRFIQAACSWED